MEIEKRYSKQQILTMYCNLVNVGHGNYGMKAAARYYFDKEPADLEPHEAAMGSMYLHATTGSNGHTASAAIVLSRLASPARPMLGKP